MKDYDYNGNPEYDSRRPARREFKRQPTEVAVKLNGPHLSFNDFNCDGSCGKMVMIDGPFYFVNLLGEERARKMCPDCTRKQIQ